MQVAVLYVRELQDIRQRADDEAHAIKAALVAHGGYPAFSELFTPQEERDKQAAEDLSREDFDEPTRWVFEKSDDFSAEEADRLLDEIMASNSHTASGDDMLPPDWEWDESKSGPIPIDWGDLK